MDEYFFCEFWMRPVDLDVSNHDTISARFNSWAREGANWSLLVLDDDLLVLQGYLQAPTGDEALDAAQPIAHGFYQKHLDQDQDFLHVLVADAAEQLEYLNAYVAEEHQLPAVNLANVMEFWAAANIRNHKANSARLYKNAPPA